MKTGFFTKTMDIEISGAAQHAAFAAGDLLFDFQEFEIPRGACKLEAVTASIRSKGDAGPTANIFAFSLLFAKAGASLGIANNVAFTTQKFGTEDYLGSIEVEATDFVGTAASTQCLAVATAHGKDLILNPDPTSGSNVGVDKYFVAGIAAGAFDFRTILRINDDDIASESPGTTLVVDGNDMLVHEHILVGDQLIAQDDAAIGTVATITNDTTLELTQAIATGRLAANDFVYVKHPITLTFHFTK